jgi:hypothetical protein
MRARSMTGPREPANDDGEPDIEREGDDREPGDFEADEPPEPDDREEDWNSIL